ncbi:MAG: hypothetical protein R6U10_02995, partial [Thermoplasmatota archaeon]
NSIKYLKDSDENLILMNQLHQGKLLNTLLNINNDLNNDSYVSISEAKVILEGFYSREHPDLAYFEKPKGIGNKTFLGDIHYTNN